MKYAILTILVFFSQLLFAQVGEIWKLSGSDVTSTLEIHSPEQEEMPVIYMKYSYEEGNEPGPTPEGDIITRNFGLFNDGALKIKYSEGENYNSLFEINNGMTKFNTSINVSGTSLISGMVWNKDDVFVENGSVGIGVTIQQLITMNEKLYVSGASTFNGFVAVTENNQMEFGKGLDKQAQAGTISYKKWSNGLDIVGAGDDTQNRLIRLWDKVSIGGLHTDNHEDAKLHVNGKIVARRIVATLDDWADYVFMPDYKLKSLNEVQDYIHEFGHLPNIPNSETVQSEGVDLAEMNRLLLEKVEELTLYVIDLQSQINDISSKDTK